MNVSIATASKRKKVKPNDNLNETKTNITNRMKNVENEENFQLTNNQKEDIKNPVKQGTIVAKIDNIYLSIKDVPPYFVRLRILLFLYTIFNLTFIWYFLSTFSPLKNNYYCFDPFSRDFKVCDQMDFCDNTHYGIKYIVFTDDSKIANRTVLQEIYNVNKNFLNFFLKDGIIYSLSNTKFDKYKEVDSFYSIVLAITTNEKWNFLSLFNQYCNKQKILIQTGACLLISVIVGNLLFGFLSDVYGRKRMLVFMGIKQFIGSVILFGATIFILSSGIPSEGDYSSPEKSFTFDYLKDPQIIRFMDFNKIQNFENQNINQLHTNEFNKNIQMHINSQIINLTFSRYKIFIYFGMVLIFLSISAGNNISLAYLLENSINDTNIYNNYNFFNYTLPLSYLLHFILLTMIGNLHIPFLISGTCILIISILIAILGKESPRHHYEFFEYKEITTIFEGILNKELLSKFYKTEEHSKFRKELNKQVNNVTFMDVICDQFLMMGYKIRARRYKEMMLQNKFHEVRRYELLKNPNLLWMIMKSNKNLKQHMLIILSLTANIGIIFFLTISKLNLTLVFSRDNLYSNIIVNSAVFYLCLVMCLSLYFFNFINKFFGYNIILFICFFMIFIFSLIYELLSLGSRHPEDMNIFVFNSIEVIFTRNGNYLLATLYIVTFFATGLFSTLFFYLTRLTKTIYRCTFYGVIHVIIDFGMVFSLPLSQYFEKNFFYVCVLSVIGFVNAYFIKEDVDNLVGDFRKIELEEDE